MALITRTFTFTDGTVAYGSQVESEIANIVNTLNSLDSGSLTWTNVKVTTLSPQADVSMGSHKITNLGTPTTSGDGVPYPVTTSSYSSAVASGTPTNAANSVTITTTGGPVLVWYGAMVASNGAGTTALGIALFIDGVSTGEYWEQDGANLSAGKFIALSSQYLHTPAAGSHTYLVKQSTQNSQGTIYNNVLAVELKA